MLALIQLSGRSPFSKMASLGIAPNDRGQRSAVSAAAEVATLPEKDQKETAREGPAAVRKAAKRTRRLKKRGVGSRSKTRGQRRKSPGALPIQQATCNFFLEFLPSRGSN